MPYPKNIKEVQVITSKDKPLVEIKNKQKTTSLNTAIEKCESAPDKSHDIRINSELFSRVKYSNGKFLLQIHNKNSQGLNAKMNMPDDTKIKSATSLRSFSTIGNQAPYSSVTHTNVNSLNSIEAIAAVSNLKSNFSRHSLRRYICPPEIQKMPQK